MTKTDLEFNYKKINMDEFDYHKIDEYVDFVEEVLGIGLLEFQKILIRRFIETRDFATRRCDGQSTYRAFGQMHTVCLEDEINELD